MSEKFLFDQEFGDGGQRRRKAREETYTAEDLAAARAEGYAQGEQAGSDAVRRSVDHQAAEALDAIAASIRQTGQEFAGFSAGWRQEAAQIALAVGRRLAARLIDREPLAEIEGMVSDCVGELLEEPRLVIRTSDAVAESIRERIDEIAANAGFQGHLVLLPDNAMTDQQCRIEWADGGVDRDPEATSREVDRAVDAFLAAH